MDFLVNNWFLIALVCVAVAASLIFRFFAARKMKDNAANFLSVHPDAAKVYLKNRQGFTMESVTVQSVNGQPPNQFIEGGKQGFYTAPGLCHAVVRYSYTRPGVIYRNVTKSTEEVEKVLECKPYKSYLLDFDRKQEMFLFSEYDAGLEKA